MSGPAYDPNQPPPPKSSSSWIWITLLVLLVLLVACGGICGGCFWWAGKTVREGVQTGFQSLELMGLQASAMEAISNNEEVSAKLGPITGYGTPALVGTYGIEQPSVACNFTVNGETASATATVTGTREAGSLRPTDIVVKFADGTSVEVPPGEFTPELNFDIEETEEMPADETMPAHGDIPEATNDPPATDESNAADPN